MGLIARTVEKITMTTSITPAMSTMALSSLAAIKNYAKDKFEQRHRWNQKNKRMHLCGKKDLLARDEVFALRMHSASFREFADSMGASPCVTPAAMRPFNRDAEVQSDEAPFRIWSKGVICPYLAISRSLAGDKGPTFETITRTCHCCGIAPLLSEKHKPSELLNQQLTQL